MNLISETPTVDEFEELVSYRKDTTGVDNTLFISPRGNARHGPRVKIAINPPDTLDPRGTIATITFAGEVIGEIDPLLLQQVQHFIEINRAVLLDYWFYRIDTKQLQQRLQSI
jgi:hypothetical protein